MYFLCNNCLHLVAFAFMTCAITCFEDLVALVFVFFSCYFSPTFWYPIIYFCGKNLCCGCKFCLLFFRLFFVKFLVVFYFQKSFLYFLAKLVACFMHVCSPAVFLTWLLTDLPLIEHICLLYVENINCLCIQHYF